MRFGIFLAALAGAAFLSVPAQAQAEKFSKAIDLRDIKPSAEKVSALKRLIPKDGRLEVQVVLRTKWDSPSKLGPKAEKAQKQAIARLGVRSVRDIPKGHGKLLRAFDGLPVYSVSVDREGLEGLVKGGDVAAVQRVPRMKPGDVGSSVAHGASLINQTGADGSGQIVAVLDTGVDDKHPHFAGRIFGGACYSRGNDCPNGKSTQFGTGAGAACTHDPICWHGTHVAGIVAGRSPAMGNGVAPGAKILPVNIFSEDADGNLYYDGNDQIDALNNVATLAELGHKIASVNMSYGGGAFKEACSDPAMETVLKRLRDAGVAPVAITHNQSLRDAMVFPACLPGVIRVGSTTFDDTVSSFSNAASYMHLWAPGSDVMAALPGGGVGPSSGTSMAAPQVAGAIAVMKQLLPTMTPDHALMVLMATGKSVKDTRAGGTVTKPRLDLYAAVRRMFELKLPGAAGSTQAVLSDDSDFDGDGLKDQAVWRPSNGTWYAFLSKTSAHMPAVQFGKAGDLPVPADYDGDGVTDVGVWRAGSWYWKRSSDGAFAPAVAWGNPGDVLVPADYDGDKLADAAVFRRGTWHIRPTSGAATTARAFGEPTDIPVPGDYDGDGKTDLAVWRPANGTWYWIRSFDGAFSEPVAFGTRGDLPVPGLWNADIRTDPAVYRWSDGKIYARTADGDVVHQTEWTRTSSVPMTANWNGDFRTDVGFLKDLNGQLNWTAAPVPPAFGLLTDIPLR